MTYKPTTTEGQALHQLAIALRPDWTNNNPGSTWYAKTSGTFPHAENFEHCIHALIAYATAQKDGKHTKRTPNLYPEDGQHWESTRPATATTGRPRKQPICQDHTAYNAKTCPVCADEINEGQRAPDQRGKRIRQVVPSPGVLNKQAQNTA